MKIGSSAVLLLLGCPIASAGDGTWNAPNGGNWSDPQNWTLAVPDSPGDTAMFTADLPRERATVTLTQPVTIGYVIIENDLLAEIAGTGPLMFDHPDEGVSTNILVARNSGTVKISAPIQAGDNDLVMGVDGGRVTLDVAGPLSSSGAGLTIEGTGTVRLGGDNQGWAGPITLMGADLVVDHENALGNPSIPTTVGGGLLQVKRSGVEPILLEGGTLLLDDPRRPYEGQLNLRAGTLRSNTDTVVAAPLVVEPNNTARVDTRRGTELRLQGGSFGDGDLTLRPTGTVRIEQSGLQHRGATRIDGGTVVLDVPIGHTGGTEILSGLLDISPDGSLVATGRISVGSRGQLRIGRTAGNDPSQHSVSPRSVFLAGGTLSLSEDIDALNNILDPASLGGVLALHGLQDYDGGGTDRVDFNQSVSGSLLRLGATDASTISADVEIRPHASDHTLRFGGGPSSLTMLAPILDFDGTATQVEQAVSGTTILQSANTYTGTTTVTGGILSVQHVLGLGDPTGETIIRGGTVVLGHRSDEPFALDGGSLVLGSSIDLAGDIELHRGTITGSKDGRTSRIIGQLVTTPGNTAVIANDAAEPLEIHGGSSGTGDLTLAPERYIRVDSTGFAHDGAVYIDGGQVGFHTANQHTGPTVVNAGQLELYRPTPETIVVNPGGKLVLVRSAQSYVNPIVLHRGILQSTSVFLGDEERTTRLTGTLTLEGGGQIGEIPYWENPFLITGDIIGTGTLHVENRNSERVRFGGPITVAGDVVVTGGAAVDGPLRQAGDFVQQAGTSETTTWGAGVAQFAGDLFVHGGRLTIKGDNAVRRAIVDGRDNFGLTELNVTAGSTLAIQEELRLLGGAVRGEIAGPLEIIKQTPYSGALGGLGSPLGSSYDGTVIVREGELHVADSFGLGSPAGPTIVEGHAGASLVLDPGAYVRDDIFLENASGVDFGGGLRGGGDVGVTGDVHLGNEGSYIGTVPGYGSGMTLNGAIHGGSLTKVGNVELRIVGDGHTYTGTTRVLQDALILADEGTLATTSGIAVAGYGRIVLDNGGRLASADRIADHIPVGLDNGSLRLIGRENALVTETIGNLNVSGQTMIHSSSAQSGSQTHLTIGRLQRSPGAVVEFHREGEGAKISLAEPPIDDGLIGAWALAGDEDFATYGPNGVTAYSDLYSYHTDLATAGPTDNVRLTNDVTLSGGGTVNSLYINNDWVVLNLGRSMLHVDSGGILGHSTLSSITNGILSGGPLLGAPGLSRELIVHASNAGITINADIVDNPNGPLGLVIAGTGEVKLGGENSYSGTTTVAGSARAIIQHPAAVPTNADLVVNGGQYFIETEGAQFDLGTVTLRNFGRIEGSNVTINADSYHVERGGLAVHLSGNGPLTKTTEGRVTLDEDNPNYLGQILVEMGTLEVRHPKGLGGGTPSPERSTTVGDGGVLQLWTDVRDELIRLDGGTLRTSRSFRGPIEVTAPSTIEGKALIQGIITGTAELTVAGPFDSRPGRTDMPDVLHLDSSLNGFNGDIRIDGGRVQIGGRNSDYSGHIGVTAVELIVDSPSGLGQAVTTVRPGGMLTALHPLDATIELSGGTLRADGGGGHFSKPLIVTEDSYVATQKDRYYGTAATAEFSGPVRLAGDARLRILGGGDVHFRSELYAGHGSQIVALDGQTHVTGTIVSDSVDASLDLAGPALMLDSSLRVQRGHRLTVQRDGEQAALEVRGAGRSVSGDGLLVNDLLLGDASVLQPGSPVGMLQTAGDLTLDDGAVYQWHIRDTGAGAGSPDGWDLLQVGGSLTLESSAASPVILQIIGVGSNGLPGRVAGFDPKEDYQWPIADAASIVSREPWLLEIDTSSFVGHNPLATTGGFEVVQSNGQLLLTYDPHALGAGSLMPGDANQDLEFDQMDIVQVLLARKYLTGEQATWGEGDWNGAPGGSPGNPPSGDGRFDQQDIVAALAAGVYLTGPYRATDPSLGPSETVLVGAEAARGFLRVARPADSVETSLHEALAIADDPGGVTGYRMGISPHPAVPEPASLTLLVLGLMLVRARVWRAFRPEHRRKVSVFDRRFRHRTVANDDHPSGQKVAGSV